MFALTSDVDWAQEFVIEEFADFASSLSIRPTFFATHKSEVIDRLNQSGKVEIGLHPNFLPGSTHGNNFTDVIEHITGLFPYAKCFRSHSFMDGAPISVPFANQGIKYDSNLCLYLEANIRPLRHSTGIMRLPVFWEEDNHWNWENMSWNVSDYFDQFMSPGLKIINVHPIHFALNSPNLDFYKNLPKPANSLTKDEIVKFRFTGKRHAYVFNRDVTAAA